MKFSVDCKEFKKVIDKASSVLAKKATVHQLECFELIASDNKLVVKANNMEQYLEIEMAVNVHESGNTYVSFEDIKKVYGLNDYVTIEVNEDKFIVNGSKKKSAVKAERYAEPLSFPELKDEELFMNIEDIKMVEVLSNLSKYLSADGNNKLFTGYSFDGVDNRIVALDGHRIGIKSMDCFKSNKKVIVPGVVCNQLKKIISKKSTLEVVVSDNLIQFNGDDFKLSSRLIEGEYFKVNQMLEFSPDFTMVVEPNELKEVAKNYVVAVKGTKTPMLFTYDNNDSVLRTGVMLSNYQTGDTIECNMNKSEGLTRNIESAFNPAFIFDAMGLFNDEVSIVGLYNREECSSKSPVLIKDDEYSVLVLPVNVEWSTIMNFKKFVA